MSDAEHDIGVEEASPTKKKPMKRKAEPKENGNAASTSDKKSNPYYSNISEIKNKMKRGEKYAKLRKDKKKVHLCRCFTPSTLTGVDLIKLLLTVLQNKSSDLSS